MSHRAGHSPHSVERAVERVDPLRAAGTPTMFLVDIRPREERYGAIGFIPGSRAVSAEVIEGDVEAFCTRYSDDATVVLVCSTGRRSEVLAEKIAALSTLHVGSLDGGTLRWAACGLPLCAVRTPSPDNVPYVPTIEKLPRALVACLSAEAIESTLDGRAPLDAAAIVRQVVREHCRDGLTIAGLEAAVEQLGEVARRAGYRLARVQENIDSFRVVLAQLAVTSRT